MARGGGGTAVYLQPGQLGGAGGGGARDASGRSSCRRPCPSPSPGSCRAPSGPRPGRMPDTRERPGQRRRRDGGDQLCPRRRRGPRALPAAGLRTRAGRSRGAAGRGELPVLRPLPEGRVRARRRVGDRQQPRRAARSPTALGHLLQRFLGQGHGREHQPQVLPAALRPHLQVSPSPWARSRLSPHPLLGWEKLRDPLGGGGRFFFSAPCLPRLPALQVAHAPLLVDLGPASPGSRRGSVGAGCELGSSFWRVFALGGLVSGARAGGAVEPPTHTSLRWGCGQVRPERARRGGGCSGEAPKLSISRWLGQLFRWGVISSLATVSCRGAEVWGGKDRGQKLSPYLQP